MTTPIADKKNEIILYKPNDSVQLEVMIENDTVWLTQAQMTVLFATTKQNISLHVKNIIKEGELQKSTVKDFLTVQNSQRNSVYANFAYTITNGEIQDVTFLVENISQNRTK
ncbi:MAG: hypothetical protein LBR36_09095 [Bacteroidales bacterium]|jgi:hypothetical protein|nr:hypothetical protein [Bacteroidales bacterium]